MADVPKTPNFRRQPVPTPPAAAASVPVPQAPGGGTLPLPTGNVVLTDYTRDQLTKLGWKEGDPVPGDLGKRIQQVQKQVTADAKSAGHGFQEGDRVKIGKTVDVAQLPPEKQAALQQHMADYKESMAQQAVIDQATAATEAQVTQNASPSVQAAQRAALHGAQAPQAPITPPGYTADPGVSVEIVQPATPIPQQVAKHMPPGLQPRAGAEVASVEGIANFITDPIPSPEDVPEPPFPELPPSEEPDPDEEASAGGIIPLERCPRCWWKLSDPFVAEPTDHEKQEFVAAVLGGGRFTKTVEVLGGQVAFIFRGLTSQEVDLTFQQLRLDSLDGAILGEAEYFMRLQEYRLYMSVEAILDGEGAKLVDIPPIYEIPYDKEETGKLKETRLIMMRGWFNQNAVSSESLRRIMAQHHRVFQNLLEALEAMSAEPDFWTGIES